MFTRRFLDQFIESVDSCPWETYAGRSATLDTFAPVRRRNTLYSAEERRRRDATRWTLVQGISAPIQFAVFLVSVSLVIRYLLTGNGLEAATASVVVKTLVLYEIMITGSIWEHQVFGRYLFAPAFFWEDVVSILVLALHTAYIAALFTGALDAQHQMLLALAAYVTYVVNATQFILKLRAARLDHRADPRLTQGQNERLGWPGKAQGLMELSK